MIDEHIRILTPEGATIALAPAGPVPRACAWALDLLIRIIIYLVGALIFVRTGGAGWGLLLLLMFVLEWFYPMIFELLWQGQTPGKRALGLRVVAEDATPVSPAASVLRNLLRAADLFPALYLAGFLSMIISPRRQRLGDLAAATLVIHDRPGTTPVQREEGEGLAPDWQTDAIDRQVLLDFLQRAARLSPRRRTELAAIALPDQPEQRAEKRLRAHARDVLRDR